LWTSQLVPACSIAPFCLAPSSATMSCVTTEDNMRGSGAAGGEDGPNRSPVLRFPPHLWSLLHTTMSRESPINGVRGAGWTSALSSIASSGSN
jgi:hypothetical protein